jgi:NAD(P)-dependent dehydrogenase (short-subunit alcohol dehydrogenase family)
MEGGGVSGGGSLEGKVAIVTGAGTGLGRAEACLLAAEGAKVVVNDLGVDVFGSGGDASSSEAVVEEIRAAGGTAVPHFGDVSNADDVDRLIATALEEFGRLDVLVNNAGIISPLRIIPDLPLEAFERMMAVHVRGSFATTIAATRHWRDEARRESAPVDASIVNTTSESVLSGSPWRVDYAAAKAAVIELTLGTAVGCGQFGVRANGIMPRAFGRMSEHRGAGNKVPQDPAKLAEETPDDVAPLVVALAGPGTRGITCQIFGVGGRRIDVMRRPEVAESLRAEDRWTPDEVVERLTDYFSTERPTYGIPFGPAAMDQLRELSGL